MQSFMFIKPKDVSSYETARIYSIIWKWQNDIRSGALVLNLKRISPGLWPRSPETPGRLKHIQKYHDMSLILDQMVRWSRTGLSPTWPLLVFRVKPTGNVCHWCYVTKIMILTQTTMFSSTSPNCECNPPIQSFIYEDVFEKPLDSFTRTFWRFASCVCGNKTGYFGWDVDSWQKQNRVYY